MADRESLKDIVDLVIDLAGEFDRRAIDYAFGGAIALGFWATPRGTVDADVTVYLPSAQPDEFLELLDEIQCEFRSTDVILSLRDYGFCRVHYRGFQLDLFLPTMDFYQTAHRRRKLVPLDHRTIQIWDAETLCVFKLMFFRLKDLADLESILLMQGAQLDRAWVRNQAEALYGSRDPRIARWDELVAAHPLD